MSFLHANNVHQIVSSEFKTTCFIISITDTKIFKIKINKNNRVNPYQTINVQSLQLCFEVCIFFMIYQLKHAETECHC